MTGTRPRTPGIWMTEHQFFSLLEELHVIRVSRPGGKMIMLDVSGEQGVESVGVTELKKRSLTALAELEERKAEIEENRFAMPVNSEINAGGSVSMRVDFVKRNDQLTPEEEKEKQGLLGDILAAIAHHRLVVGGMNYLQVHYRELEPELVRREFPLDQLSRGQTMGERLRWSKGIKSAALFCIRESEKESNTGKPMIDICREFLTLYAIEGDEAYSPDQLFGNIQQILLLDRTG